MAHESRVAAHAHTAHSTAQAFVCEVHENFLTAHGHFFGLTDSNKTRDKLQARFYKSLRTIGNSFFYGHFCENVRWNSLLFLATRKKSCELCLWVVTCGLWVISPWVWVVSRGVARAVPWRRALVGWGNVNFSNKVWILEENIALQKKEGSKY